MSDNEPLDGVKAEVSTDFYHLMVLREGERTQVYSDSRGLATVGIGHLVRPQDNLKLKDVISEQRVQALFASDSADALAAAWMQADDAGITSTAFLPYLASVNFQLGTSWTHKFPETWAMIVSGDYAGAADALEDSVWKHQTPVRVEDFQDALRALPPKAPA